MGDEPKVGVNPITEDGRKVLLGVHSEEEAAAINQEDLRRRSRHRAAEFPSPIEEVQYIGEMETQS